MTTLECYYQDGVRLGLHNTPKDYLLFSGRTLITSSRSFTEIVRKMDYLMSLRADLRIDVVTSETQYTIWDCTMGQGAN